jgi:hypothetical protein
MALLTWTEFCAYEGSDPSETEDKTRIEKLIASATATIEKYCSRFFESASRTVLDQWKSSTTFKAIPVTAFQVFVDSEGVFGPETEVTKGYWLDKESGILAWNTPFSTLAQVKIVYTGGFQVIPEDLKEAVFKTVKWDKARIFSNQVGIRSQVSGEITTNYDTALPYEVRQTLDLYRLP